MKQKDVMNSESEGPRRKAIDQFVESLGDQFYAEIEARVDDPDYLPEPVEWLDHSDPLGMNWTWLFPGRDEDS